MALIAHSSKMMNSATPARGPGTCRAKVLWLVCLQKELQRAIYLADSLSLQNAARECNASQLLEGMKRSLAVMQDGLAVLHRSDTGGNREPGEAAQRVFGIVELVEQIFCHLDQATILKAAAINRTSAATVSGSRMLKRKLCLASEADSSSFYRSPLADSDFPQIEYVEQKDALHKTTENALNIEIRFGSDSSPLPRVGQLGRQMLLCQPPAYEAAVEVSCCSMAHIAIYHNLPRPAKLETVSSAMGLTVGDLLDRAAELREQHRECVYAEWHQLDDDGCVRPRVTFSYKVPLSEDDLIFDVRRQFEAAARQKVVKADAKRKRFQPVVDARRRALFETHMM